MEDKSHSIVGCMGTDLVSMAKSGLCITTEDTELSDNEIAEICKYLAKSAPDTRTVGVKTVFGPIGIGLLLSVSLYFFPEFYSRHELWQRN